MEENLLKLEQFFNYNLKIKRLLTFYPDVYSQEDAIKYEDEMLKRLQEIKYMLLKMIEFTGNNPDLIKHLNNLFKNYKKSLLSCHYNPAKLRQFYRTCLADMDPQLVDEINQEIKGYYIFSNYMSPFLKSQTINELLHVLHMQVTNTETLFTRMPLVATKNINEVEQVKLYGCQNEVAKMIFDNLNADIDVHNTDILALKNKILIMARDLGHALTIEIELDGHKAVVNYFIPKICNVAMVNSLEGINPVKTDDNNEPITPYAKGSFEVEIDDLIPHLLTFLKNVPQDKDVIIKRM